MPTRKKGRERSEEEGGIALSAHSPGGKLKKKIRKNEPVTVMYHRPAGGLVRKALRKGKSRKTLTFE